MQHIHQDHCTDLPFEEFSALCQLIWKTKFNFLTIDLSSSLLNGKYRENLERFYIPKAFLPSSDEGEYSDMAFIDIANPIKRKEIVEEYIKMRNEIREKNENKKASNLLKEQAIEAKFRPIISATEKSAEKITAALGHETSTPYEFYSSLTKNRDKYFSIYRTNGGFFRIGNTDIQIDEGSTIDIGGTRYQYTPGLWDLLMLNKPDDGEYTDDDLARYKEIVEMIDLINNPHTPNSKTHYKLTAKYKFLENLLGMGPAKGKRRRMEKDGEGIILPGDINSLKDRLRLVYGERAAGNVEATTPEIAAILDEFLRRKHISKSEYNAVCKELQC